MVALRRDHFLCKECRKYGRRVQADVVHHIQEIDIAPRLAYSLSNMESLCKECHNKRHPEKGGQGKVKKNHLR